MPNRNKISIKNRDKNYDYLIFRREDTSSLMKIDPQEDTVDFIIGTAAKEDYIVDRNIKTHGLADPELEILKNKGFIEFKALPNKGKTYYYGTVAKKNNKVQSEMSIVTCSLNQNEESIENVLVKNGEELVSFKKDLKLLVSSLLNPIVPKIREEDIVMDNSNVILGNKLIIKIPNVWYDIDRIYSFRDYLPIKIYAKSGNLKTIPKTIFKEEEKAYQPIQKIELLRKDITNVPEDIGPSSIDETNVSIQKIILLEGGFYETNKSSILPLNIILEDQVSSVFNNQYLSPILKIEDRVERGRKYKYTVRLFDENKKVSEPTVFVITL